MDPIFPNEESQQVIHGTPGCAQVKSVSSQKCQPQVDPELTVKVNLTINLLCQPLSQIARGEGVPACSSRFLPVLSQDCG
jgi:hypothetical protein